jgi:signal peptidase I
LENHSHEEIKTISQDGEQKEKGSSWMHDVWEWAKAIAIALILALIIRTYLFAPTIVDGESMMHTLKNHERLIVNKIVYILGHPKRGDIVVFHATEDKDFIKRVIGVAGDRIEMKDDVLYVNGKVVEEPYLEKNKSLWTGPGPYTNDFIVEEVPKGTVYVLGDNRQNSTDSRMLGPIPEDQIVGRADLAFWPIKSFRLLK